MRRVIVQRGDLVSQSAIGISPSSGAGREEHALIEGPAWSVVSSRGATRQILRD